MTSTMTSTSTSIVRRRHLGVVVALVLLLAGCGSAAPSDGPGAGLDPDSPVQTSDGDVGTDDDGNDGPGPLLSDTVGDSPLYIDEIDVRVAESYPVQLFLDVVGSTPTPCHKVAYSVDTEADTITVQLTTVAQEGMCAQVLQPVQFAVPLGHAELPVTVSVNDGEFVTTIDG